MDETLKLFGNEFPPSQVYKGKKSLETYLLGETGGVPHQQILFEEMIMLWLSNMNPAFTPYKNELFDDRILVDNSSYLKITKEVEIFFKSLPTFGPNQQDILDLLKSPAKASPNSLSGQ